MDGALLQNVILGLATASSRRTSSTASSACSSASIGVLPGIGALAAISMLFPMTFYLEPTTALVMLAGIYYGAAYGGSTASILLNLPGTPSAPSPASTAIRWPSRAAPASRCFMTTVASFIGGSDRHHRS